LGKKPIHTGGDLPNHLGAVRIEGVVNSLLPLPLSPHLGPVAAELLEKEDVNFICSNGLEQSGLKRGLGL